MGKPSKRAARAARDVHLVIREHAQRLKAAPFPGVSAAESVPEVAELLTACREAVEGAVPAAVVFKGRRYYLRVRLALQLDVFDAPGAGEPLIRGASFSTEGFGHAPGH